MLFKNPLRRDLPWLRRQTRMDRRITLCLLAGVAAAWVRQLTPADAMPPSGFLLALSIGLVTASLTAWLVAAFLTIGTLREPKEPTRTLRWATRVSRAKEWAFSSLAAYVAWHLLRFLTALLAG